MFGLERFDNRVEKLKKYAEFEMSRPSLKNSQKAIELTEFNVLTRQN